MRTVYIDVDTQLDFLCPAGALYVPGAEEIVTAVAALNRHAAEQGFPLISTTDAHAEDDIEFRTWPSHCIRGTLGQRKAVATLLADPVVVPFSRVVPDFQSGKQFIVEKTSLDPFSNPNLEALLKVLNADRYVVYGVVTEICVRLAAQGLLERTGKPVEIVEDAVRHLNEAERDRTFAALVAAGATLTHFAALR